MPTVLTHPAVPLALGLGLGRHVISQRLLAAGVAASILPDLDVVTFHFGLGYAHELGHRGASHSLLFAGVVALVGACAARALRTTSGRALWFLFLATASHGVLDAFTNGGLGIAFLWPWSAHRYFFPVQMIEVSPLGLRPFLSAWGVKVLLSELLWVWIPCSILWWTLAVIPRPPHALSRSG
jgi:inner membrane protein